MEKLRGVKRLRGERTKQGLRLRLLALILAFALSWYSINPAPATIIRTRREDDQTDDKKRRAAPETRRAPLSLQLYSLRPWEKRDAPHSSSQSSLEDVDDFDWPEFIDG